MLLVASVSDDGTVRRYRRGPGQRPQEIGRADMANARAEDIFAYRRNWTPPEDPRPNPTPPLRSAMRRAA